MTKLKSLKRIIKMIREETALLPNQLYIIDRHSACNMYNTWF
jgi:hypothetical protein